MGCGCGKKAVGGTVHFMGREGSTLTEPTEWGPILWKYLHTIAEKSGTSNNQITDGDQAKCLEIMLGTLPLIVPCTECQAHAAAYLTANPLPLSRSYEGMCYAPLRASGSSVSTIMCVVRRVSQFW